MPVIWAVLLPVSPQAHACFFTFCSTFGSMKDSQGRLLFFCSKVGEFFELMKNLYVYLIQTGHWSESKTLLHRKLTSWSGCVPGSTPAEPKVRSLLCLWALCSPFISEHTKSQAEMPPLCLSSVSYTLQTKSSAPEPFSSTALLLVQDQTAEAADSDVDFLDFLWPQQLTSLPLVLILTFTTHCYLHNAKSIKTV